MACHVPNVVCHGVSISIVSISSVSCQNSDCQRHVAATLIMCHLPLKKWDDMHEARLFCGIQHCHNGTTILFCGSAQVELPAPPQNEGTYAQTHPSRSLISVPKSLGFSWLTHNPPPQLTPGARFLTCPLSLRGGGHFHKIIPSRKK